MKANTTIWIALILLSALSFSMGGTAASAFILTAAGLKSAMVGWQFMDLRSAHPIWQIGLFVLLGAILAAVFLLTPPHEPGDCCQKSGLRCNGDSSER